MNVRGYKNVPPSPITSEQGHHFRGYRVHLRNYYCDILKIFSTRSSRWEYSVRRKRVVSSEHVINDFLLLLFGIDVHLDDPLYFRSNKLTVAVKERLVSSCVLNVLTVKKYPGFRMTASLDSRPTFRRCVLPPWSGCLHSRRQSSLEQVH